MRLLATLPLVLSLLLFPPPSNSGALGASESARESSRAIDFATSCDPALAPAFNHAVELLHSFEYPESESSFRAILESAPECAMARWGVAMNRWHPLWAPPSAEDLRVGAEMLAGIDRAAITPREAAFVEALAGFFKDSDTVPHPTRARLYEGLMNQVYRDHLDDPEATLFYALAVLGSADPKDKSYGQQFRAAALLNWVGIERPLHPGVLHYLIHSYDYPGMAHLALPAATVYAAAAPDSAHAQHMPSHIFTRLGLWDRSIASNHDSTASAAAYTARAHLPGHYDEGLHSIDYLMYALLQVARDDDALALLGTLAAIDKTSPENFKVAYTYASSPARYALERRQWEEASRIELQPVDFPWNDYPWARSIHHFARALGAARSAQLDLARQELAAIESIAAALPDDILPYWREEVFVQADVIAAWILAQEDQPDEALRLARAAADREDAVDKHPVTPGEVLPARELLADLLLELGQAEAALAQYRTVLAGSPNRANALLGAARAAQRAGQTAAAAAYYVALVEQTATGDADRAGLSEAREHIARDGA